MSRIEVTHAQLAALGELAADVKSERLAIEDTNLRVQDNPVIAVLPLIGSRKGRAFLISGNGKRTEI